MARTLVTMAALAALVAGVPAAAQPSTIVDNEVVLVLDGSGSLTTGEWRSLTAAVGEALKNRSVLPLGRTQMSVVAFGGTPDDAPADEQAAVTSVIMRQILLDAESTVTQYTQRIRGARQISGGTAVTAGLQEAAGLVAGEFDGVRSTMCLITDGVENIADQPLSSVDFLRTAGVDDFSVIAFEDEDASAADLQAAYGPLVFGDGRANIVRTRGFARRIIDGCFNPAITVEAIEVTQGVQDPQLTVELVRNRPTVVMVLGHTQGIGPFWSGTLELLDGDGELVAALQPRTPFNTNLPSGTSYADLRRLAIEFVVPADLTDRPLMTFRFVPDSGDVDCRDLGGTCSVTMPLQTFDRGLLFLGFDVARTRPGGAVELLHDADSPRAFADAAVLADVVEHALPFSLVDFDYAPTGRTLDVTQWMDADDTARATGDAFQARRSSALHDVVTDVALDMALDYIEGIDLPPGRIVYGIFGGVPMGGVAQMGTQISIGAELNTKLTAAHEIGHSLGLPHGADLPGVTREGVVVSWTDACGAESTEERPLTRSIQGTIAQSLGQAGTAEDELWGHTTFGPQMPRILIEPTDVPLLLGYCVGNGIAPIRWMGGDQWRRILEEDTTYSPSYRDSTSLDAGEDGTVQIGEVRRRQVPARPTGPPTHTVRVLRGDGGELVSEHEVSLVRGPPDPAEAGDLRPGPIQSPTRQNAPVTIADGEPFVIEVIDADGVRVGRQEVSANAPAIDITSITGEGPAVTVAWDAADTDGDVLAFDIQVRTSGEPWIPLADAVTGSSATIDPSAVVPSGSIDVRVVASDGMRIADDVQRSFDYESTTLPLIGGAITAPLDGDVFTHGDLIEFDLVYEDAGGLTNQRWHSSIDGPFQVAQGVAAAATLSAGVHEITASIVRRQEGDDDVVEFEPVTITIHDVVAERAEGPGVLRLSGPDRFATAASISAQQWSDGAGTVFLTSGESFPDALTAGPAAASIGAPVLLTSRNSLPAATSAELARLQPTAVVFIGGTASVADSVVDAVRQVVPEANLRRVSGPDRFATSAVIAERYFNRPERVYLATGGDFPDALAGGVAAGAADAPVLLVRQNSIPQVTQDHIDGSGPEEIVILGGEAAIGTDVVSALQAQGFTVSRRSGPDRFSTAVATGDGAASSTVWIATGRNFPDGLAVTPAVALAGVPILLTEPTHAPRATLQEIARLGATSAVIVGGEAAVSSAAAEQITDVLQQNVDDQLVP